MWEFDSLIPNQTAAHWVAVFSGHSAVGSAPRSGRGGRGFKSRCSDLKKQVHIRVLAFLFSRARDLNSTAAQSAAKKAPVGLSLVRGSQSSGMSIVGDCRFTFVCRSFSISAAGFEQQQSRPPPAAETGRRGWGRAPIFQGPVRGCGKIGKRNSKAAQQGKQSAQWAVA